MKKEGNIVRYKASDLPPVSADDIARLRAIKDEAIDFSDIPPITDEQWKMARSPVKTQMVELAVEQDVLGWFQAHSEDYRASISQVLRHYVMSHEGMR